VGQRINIQYSIDMDDLDTEVQRLLDVAYANLENITPTTVKHPDPLSLSAMEEIDALRQKLAAADYTLQDATNIISGYLSFKAQEAVAPVETPIEAPIDEVSPQE
jgi:hypothetical protein